MAKRPSRIDLLELDIDLRLTDLWREALIVCLGLALYAAVAGTLAAVRRRQRLAESAENAILAALPAAAVASLVLLVGLLNNDFSLAYVADHTSHELPLAYTVSAFWGGQEGSLLLWLLILTGFSAIAVLLARRSARSLLAWTVLLVIGAFSLALFGTFLTRSGIISSIHSFTESSIGPWFLGFIGLVVAASVALVISRLPLLRARTRLESPVSREATFLYNNLLLVAFCLTILWGVLYPILTEALRGEPITVGPPYYNFFLKAFGLPLLLLMGIGPLVAWRRASLRSLGRTFAWPAAIALVVEVERDGRSLGTLEAGKNRYRAEGQVSNEVGIRSDWRTGEDLFVIADEIG